MCSWIRVKPSCAVPIGPATPLTVLTLRPPQSQIASRLKVPFVGQPLQRRVERLDGAVEIIVVVCCREHARVADEVDPAEEHAAPKEGAEVADTPLEQGGVDLPKSPVDLLIRGGVRAEDDPEHRGVAVDDASYSEPLQHVGHPLAQLSGQLAGAAS